MKYLKSLAWSIIPVFIFSILLSGMYYFDWISPKIYSFLEFLTPALSLFVGGLYLGKHSTEKGWLEGMKLGGGMILFLFIFSYLAFQTGFSLKSFVYYLILFIITTFGSMLGIRNVDTENK